MNEKREKSCAQGEYRDVTDSQRQAQPADSAKDTKIQVLMNDIKTLNSNIQRLMNDIQTLHGSNKKLEGGMAAFTAKYL